MNTVSVSDEKQFIYRDSFNKGHVQIPSMVTNCLGISNDAKTVYSNIIKHIYEKGHYAFPSTYKLALSSCCSVNSVITYIDELVDNGFIIKEKRGRGRSNHYHVREVHEVPLLHVSEMFWRCMASLNILYGWKRILPAKDKIIRFMRDEQFPLQHMEVDEESKKQLTDLLKHVLEGGCLEVGILPKNLKYQKRFTVPEKVEAPAAVTVVKELMPTSPISKRPDPVGINKNHWRMVNVSEWVPQQFIEYYYDKYLDITGQPHPVNKKKHTGMMRRIVKTMDGKHELLRGYIDTLFEIGYENVTLDYFSSNRIGEIQAYILSGKKPFYLGNKEPKIRDVESGVIEQTETVSSEEMLKKMLRSRD